MRVRVCVCVCSLVARARAQNERERERNKSLREAPSFRRFFFASSSTRRSVETHTKRTNLSLVFHFLSSLLLVENGTQPQQPGFKKSEKPRAKEPKKEEKEKKEENPKLIKRGEVQRSSFSPAVLFIFSLRKKKEKKTLRRHLFYAHKKQEHTHIRKKCLNQKDQRSGSIWVRRTPASACGACSCPFFFESLCLFFTRGE